MNLKILRKKNKKTQIEVAEYIGITQSNYSKYEQEIIEPNINQLCKLAELYNISLDELVGRKKEEIVLTEKKALLEKIEQLNEIECKKLNIFADGLILNRISEQKERTFKLIKDNNKGE